MKQSCLAVFFAAFFACNAQAQETSTLVSAPAPKDSSLNYLRNPVQKSDEPLSEEVPENFIEPSFPGGLTEMMRFLGRHIHYPETARLNNIEGKVVLSFIVEKNGSISNITALNNIGGDCAEEAARVVATMPKWTPGMADGRPVRVRYELPVVFKLEGFKKSKRKKKRDSLPE